MPPCPATFVCVCGVHKSLLMANVKVLAAEQPAHKVPGNLTFSFQALRTLSRPTLAWGLLSYQFIQWQQTWSEQRLKKCLHTESNLSCSAWNADISHVPELDKRQGETRDHLITPAAPAKGQKCE